MGALLLCGGAAFTVAEALLQWRHKRLEFDMSEAAAMLPYTYKLVGYERPGCCGVAVGVFDIVASVVLLLGTSVFAVSCFGLYFVSTAGASYHMNLWVWVPSTLGTAAMLLAGVVYCFTSHRRAGAVDEETVILELEETRRRMGTEVFANAVFTVACAIFLVASVEGFCVHELVQRWLVMIGFLAGAVLLALASVLELLKFLPHRTSRGLFTNL
eukprot:TRINITY_DN9055_c0_g1_i3.p1 TRINITY_DN9055_c0_g1~~TRINITY_DN9055_c0_g1_i3.p1  ORF type:complete len:214 (-),score=54.11 TRINITY_DN9055_c0_g1_i3:35-676(-)